MISHSAHIFTSGEYLTIGFRNTKWNTKGGNLPSSGVLLSQQWQTCVVHQERWRFSQQPLHDLQGDHSLPSTPSTYIHAVRYKSVKRNISIYGSQCQYWLQTRMWSIIQSTQEFILPRRNTKWTQTQAGHEFKLTSQVIANSQKGVKVNTVTHSSLHIFLSLFNSHL